MGEPTIEDATARLEAAAQAKEVRERIVTYLRELADLVETDLEHNYALHVNVSAQVRELHDGPWVQYIENGNRDIDLKVALEGEDESEL